MRTDRQWMLGSGRLGAFVITYNRPHLLKSTLEAVLRQTVAPEVVLVIDNGDAKGPTTDVLAGFPAEKVTLCAQLATIPRR